MLQQFFFSGHLDDDEAIHAVVHKHWLMGLKVLIWPTAIFFGLWILLYSMPDKYIFYGVTLSAIASLVWWVRNFLDYYLDAWVITNKGVIDLEWHGWFHRTSSRILYSDIQAVSYEIHGIAATLMRYGDIAIEKISTGATVSMPYAPRPKQIESLILHCLETYMHKKNLKDAKTVQGILADFVAGSMQSKDFSSKKPTGVMKQKSS